MPDPFPAETDRVMVASAGVLTAPDPEINVELASDGTAPVKKKRRKLGFGFWFSVIWIFLVVFGAASRRGSRSTTPTSPIPRRVWRAAMGPPPTRRS